MAFLSPVCTILDGKTYNISYIIHYIDDIKQYQWHSSSIPVHLNFWHLALSFTLSLYVRKGPIRRSRGAGACSLVSKLSIITYFGRFKKTALYNFSWRKYRLYWPITWCESRLAIGWLLYSGWYYRQTSNISRTLVGNIIVDSDVVGASPYIYIYIYV